MKDEFMHATGSYTAQDPSLTLAAGQVARMASRDRSLLSIALFAAESTNAMFVLGAQSMHVRNVH